MTDPTSAKNIFFDSDDEKPIAVEEPIKPKEPWKQSVTKYAILSKFQIEQLEMEFIKRRLRLSRNNIKCVSKDLKIPFKRALNYFNNRLKMTDNRILKHTLTAIKELEKINSKLEVSWSNYLENNDSLDEKIKEIEKERCVENKN